MIAFQQLEYNKIKDLLSQECHNELGREIAEKLHPLNDKKKIEYNIELTQELQELLRNKIFYNLENISNIRELLCKQKHQTFNFEEFRKIYFNLRAANIFYADLENFEEQNNFQQLIRKIKPYPELEKRFQQIFDSQGEIKDDASPELLSIRKRKKKVRHNIVSELNNKMEDLSSNNFLFDKIITQRDNRFVIPVKDSSVPFVSGIVHGRSSSKSSVFVEPEEVVGMNNEMDLLGSEEKQEIFRIMKDFTNSIKAYREEILDNTEILKITDFFFASARLANKYNSQKPIILKEPILRLIKARHPLLIESYEDINKVIPFDLELGKNYKLLVISGPNTGGKTVTLKTVGLLVLMALSGLPIPAKPNSKIGIFNKIFADIGDNQSLENALSTFSSHIETIKEMINSGDSSSLVLIDEIGASTDPEQGSALAQSILENLVKKEVLGVITTHYTALKVFAEQNQSCINAAMQFDSKKHIPTFQFKLGLPGNSFAIEVASKLGMDKDLLERAKNLTGNQSVELTEILKKISKEKIELSRQNYQFQLKTSLLNKKISEHQNKIDELKKEGEELKKKSIQEAREFLTSLQKELNLEIENIKKTERKNRKNLLENSLKKVTKLNKNFGIEESNLTFLKGTPLKEPSIGKTVWIKDFEATGEIVGISEDMIKVDVGGIFYTTQLENLFLTKIASKNRKSKRIKIPQKQIKMELKILGFTFDEAQPVIESFIDDAIVGGLGKIRIVHGKGTGALRSKVRQFLRRNKRVADFFSPPPEAGGDGVTVVSIKN